MFVIVFVFAAAGGLSSVEAMRLFRLFSLGIEITPKRDVGSPFPRSFCFCSDKERGLLSAFLIHWVSAFCSLEYSLYQLQGLQGVLTM